MLADNHEQQFERSGECLKQSLIIFHIFLESRKANKSNKRRSDLNRNLSPNKATDLRVARLGGHNTIHPKKKHKKSKWKPGRVE